MVGCLLSSTVEPLHPTLTAEPDVGQGKWVATLVAEPGHFGTLGPPAAVAVAVAGRCFAHQARADQRVEVDVLQLG